MNDPNSRFLSAGFCLLCLVAVWCGALFEIGRQKRGATISPRHFRWRMISALLWSLILGLLILASLRFWPQNSADTENAKRFVALSSGAILLLLPAFALLIFDFYLTAQTRKLQTAHLDQDLGALARREIEAAQQEAKNKQEARNRAQNSESGENS